MLKFNRRNKKLIIPVGLNPNYNIDVSALVNTSDADITPNNVVKDKIAYGPDGKVIGTLDINSALDESYNQGFIEGESIGYSDGVDVGRNQIIDEQSDANITPQDVLVNKIGYGANNQKVVGELNLDNEKQESYNSGYDNGVTVGETSGIIIGRQEIIDEQSDANITADKVFSGYVGYGANNERIVGNYEFVEGFDFSSIGYDASTSDDANLQINDDIVYSKTFYDRWNNETRPNFSSFFKNNKTLKYVPNVNLEKSINTSADSAFDGCKNITYVPLLNTSKFTIMTDMFYGCSNLTSVPLFNTSNVTNMSYMFSNCSNLTSVPLFNTSNVTSMSVMFQNCSNLTSVPEFNTGNVTSMSSMFYGCLNLTSVPLFNTSNVTNMSSMFYGCSNLTSVPEFNTGSATTLQNMFYNCNSLTSVPEFNTGSATTLQNMFYNTSVTECPAFNTSNVTNADGFLNGCSKMVTINLLDFSKVNNTGGLGIFNTLNGLKELINVAGFINFGKGFTGSKANGFTLTSSTKLTVESCLNIFNNLYDMNLNTTYNGTPTIQLSSTTKSLLSPEDIAIATSKGWTVA